MISNIAARMEVLAESDDSEKAHIEADQLLVEALRELQDDWPDTIPRLLRAYENVRKVFA